MRTFCRELFLFVGVSLLAPIEVLAQNTSSGAAGYLTIGQQAVVQPLANNTQEGWFFVLPISGRSYCASVTLSQSSAFFAPGITFGDPVVFVLDFNGAVVASNDNALTEPQGAANARACFRWPTNAAGYVVAVQNTNFASIYDVRIIETTMFCPWFFTAGDYNAFSLIRNTTDLPVNFTINWRSPAGAIVGTFSGTLGGNGNIALNARSFVPANVTSGSVEISHNGSEDALKASTTTLSASTGLGFDALFERRHSQ